MAAAAGSTTISERPEAHGGPVRFGPAPFASCPGVVLPEWIDENDHLNLAYYIVLFDRATDALWGTLGLGAAYRRATGCGTFAVETHTIYLTELLVHERTRALSWVVGADSKRLHVAHDLIRDRDGAVSARHELMFLNVDLVARRSVPWPAATLARLRAAQNGAEAPAWVGRRLAIPPSR